MYGHRSGDSGARCVAVAVAVVLVFVTSSLLVISVWLLVFSGAASSEAPAPARTAFVPSAPVLRSQSPVRYVTWGDWSRVQELDRKLEQDMEMNSGAGLADENIKDQTMMKPDDSFAGEVIPKPLTQQQYSDHIALVKSILATTEADTDSLAVESTTEVASAQIEPPTTQYSGDSDGMLHAIYDAVSLESVTPNTHTESTISRPIPNTLNTSSEDMLHTTAAPVPSLDLTQLFEKDQPDTESDTASSDIKLADHESVSRRNEQFSHIRDLSPLTRQNFRKFSRFDNIAKLRQEVFNAKYKYPGFSMSLRDTPINYLRVPDVLANEHVTKARDSASAPGEGRRFFSPVDSPAIESRADAPIATTSPGGRSQTPTGPSSLKRHSPWSFLSGVKKMFTKMWRGRDSSDKLTDSNTQPSRSGHDLSEMNDKLFKLKDKFESSNEFSFE